MIDFNKAIDIVLKCEKGVKIDSVLDLGDVYVISVIGEDGYEIDDPPFAVDKNTGEVTVYFPPEYIETLKNAKFVGNGFIRSED